MKQAVLQQKAAITELKQVQHVNQYMWVYAGNFEYSILAKYKENKTEEKEKVEKQKRRKKLRLVEQQVCPIRKVRLC